MVTESVFCGQDLWEMIVTFIISQQNNIRRIRRCIETICEAYGSRCTARTAPFTTGFRRLPSCPAQRKKNCGL